MLKTFVMGLLTIGVIGIQTPSSYADTQKEIQKAQKKVEHYDRKVKKLEKNLQAERKNSAGTPEDGAADRSEKRLQRNKIKQIAAEKNLKLMQH